MPLTFEPMNTSNIWLHVEPQSSCKVRRAFSISRSTVIYFLSRDWAGSKQCPVLKVLEQLQDKHRKMVQNSYTWKLLAVLIRGVTRNLWTRRRSIGHIVCGPKISCLLINYSWKLRHWLHHCAIITLIILWINVSLGKLTKFFNVQSGSRLEATLLEKVTSLGWYNLLLTSPTVPQPLSFGTMSLDA